MNQDKFIQLINKPNAISKKETIALAQILDEFPYFQTARVLNLKGLKNQQSFLYNKALKKTAAYTTNRTVLFNFITTDTLDFDTISQNEKQIINEIDVIDSTVIDHLFTSIKISEEKNKNFTTPQEKVSKKNVTIEIQKEGKIIDEIVLKSTKEKSITNSEILEIGKPIKFNTNDVFSFNEWLQLDIKKPIKRKVTKEKTENQQNNDEKDLKKVDLIQQFIKNNPKIKPLKNQVITNVLEDSSLENVNLMTETLARVYLEQKKYKKAIAAFKILSLKYPEKSSFFADRIKAVKFLENHKL